MVDYNALLGKRLKQKDAEIAVKDKKIDEVSKTLVSICRGNLCYDKVQTILCLTKEYGYTENERKGKVERYWQGVLKF